MGEQGPHRPLVEAYAGELAAAQDGRHHQPEILAPAPQGQELQHETLQPPEQVVSELAQRHELLQVAVGGRHHAQIHRHRTGRTHREDLSLLEHPQEYCLRLEGKIADLIEKQGPPVGGTHQSRAIFDGTRERPLAVTE